MLEIEFSKSKTKNWLDFIKNERSHFQTKDCGNIGNQTFCTGKALSILLNFMRQIVENVCQLKDRKSRKSPQ
jgi:hypothetical protein